METVANIKGTEIIGFDLGHGETALTRTDLSTTAEPKPLEVHAKTNFITAVIDDANLGVQIGDDAFATDDPRGPYMYFKSSQISDPKTRIPTKMFVRKIIDILLTEKKIIDIDQTQFVVGCPSAWSQEVRDQYKSLLMEAGLSQVTIVAESRAAFLTARDNKEDNVSDKQLAGSVLIIDIGSSTTDYTRVLDLKDAPVGDEGDPALGASLIDKAIFNKVLGKHPNKGELETAFSIAPRWKAECIVASRKAKERYFSNETKYVNQAAGESCLVEGETDITFAVKLTKPFVDEILCIRHPELDNVSWLDAYRASLQQVKVRMQGSLPAIIILTGGASRMGFTSQICEEVFPDAIVKRGKQPELAIAQGLALAGRYDRKVKAFRAAVEELSASKKIEATVRENLHPLLEKIAEAVTPEVLRFSLQSFDDWREGKIGILADMGKKTEEAFKEWVTSPEGKKCIAQATVEWYKELRPKIKNLTDPICDQYGIPRSTMELPHEGPSGEGGLGGTIDPLNLFGVDDFAAVVAWIVTIIIGVLASGILFHAFHPVGMVVAIIVSILALAVGYEKAKEIVENAHTPVFSRKIISKEKVRSKLEDQLDKMRLQAVMSIEQDEQQVDQLCSKIAETIHQNLNKEADQAILILK